MYQDDTTNIPGYVLNKYNILSDDLIISQSNYHFPDNKTEVFTTGWPNKDSLCNLAAAVAVWRIKERKQLA